MTKTIILPIEGNTALQPMIPLYFAKPREWKGSIYRKKLVRFTPKEYRAFKDFVRECHYTGFIHVNNYMSVNEAREFFYRWFIDELIKKVSKRQSKQIRFITFTQPEVRTLKAMWRRIDCSDEQMALERKFID